MDPLFWPILLLVMGLALAVLEFFLPSGGVLSFLAAASMIGSLVLAFMTGTRQGAIMLTLVTFAIPILLAVAVRWWPHTPIGRLILINRPEDPDELLPESDAYRGLRELIGKRGITKTRMMPSGSVSIEGRTYDAVSQGMPIDPRSPVQVVDIRTHRIVVRPAAGEPSLSAPGDTAEEPTADDILSQPIDSLGLDDFEGGEEGS